MQSKLYQISLKTHFIIIKRKKFIIKTDVVQFKNLNDFYTHPQ